MHQTRRPDREPHCSTCKAAFDEFRAHVAARVLDLEARLARVEAQRPPRRRGPRDDSDRLAFVKICTLAAHRVFTAPDVWQLATADAELAALLAQAEIVSAKSLGIWLQRMRDAPVAGLVLVSCGHKRRGWLWRVLQQHV